MNRREALIYLFLLPPATALAKKISFLSSLPVDEHFYGFFMSRYHEWYCKNWFDFKKSLSAIENQYISEFFENTNRWEFALKDRVLLNSCNYTAVFKDKSSDFSSLCLGDWGQSDKLVSLAKQVLLHRGLKELAGNIKDQQYRLGWNVQNELFFYEYIIEKPDLSRFAPLLEKESKVADPDYAVKRLVFKKSRPIAEKYILFGQQSRSNKLQIDPKYVLERYEFDSTVVNTFKTYYQLMYNNILQPSFFNANSYRFMKSNLNEFSLSPSEILYVNQNETELVYPPILKRRKLDVDKP